MNTELREAIFLTRTLEILMEKDGAIGLSFSEKVKSYDKEDDREDLSHIGHKFYRDKLDGQYYRKQDNQESMLIDDEWVNYDEYEDEELDRYRKFKNHKDYLIGGHYRNLRDIGHERNQMMHIDGYTIDNFNQFKRKAESAIEYFKNEKKITLNEIDYFTSREDTNQWVQRQERTCLMSRKNHDKLYDDVHETAFQKKKKVIESELKEAYTFQYKMKEFWIYAIFGLAFGYMFYTIYTLESIDQVTSLSVIILLMVAGIVLLMQIDVIKRKWFSFNAENVVVVNTIIVMAVWFVLDNLYRVDLQIYYLVTLKFMLVIYAVGMMISVEKTMLYTWYTVTFIPRVILMVIELLILIIEYIFELIKLILSIAVPVAAIGFILWIFVLKSPSESSDTSSNYPKSSLNIDDSAKKAIGDYAEKVTNKSSQKDIKQDKLRFSNTKTTLINCEDHYVRAKTLNIRSEPNVQAKIVDKLRKNEKLCITVKEGSWFFIKDRGWVHSDYLSETQVKEIKKKVQQDIWHCEAKSIRASGWVERVGKQNAINGALHQCEIRRVSDVKCSLTSCYQVR